MKSELSSLDLHFLVIEFQELLDAKVDKVFQKSELFIFQLFLPGKGKRFLKVLLPGFIFATDSKGAEDAGDSFALDLRKHISNSRIRAIRQKEFERIVEIELEIRGKRLLLLIELFKPGNIILCDSDYKIIVAHEYKGFGTRLIRPGIMYDYPKKEFNFLELKEGELKKALGKSDKNSIVVTLAVDLGLGGLYSEELLNEAAIDKTKQELSDNEIMRLFDAMKALKSKGHEGYSYEDEIAPFELGMLKEKRVEKKASFNDALSEYLSKKIASSSKTETLTKHQKEKSRVDAIIRTQKAQIAGLELSASESQRKGELIYERYQVIKNILEELKKARAKYSLSDIKERLKGHAIIKEVNAKDKKIVVELE